MKITKARLQEIIKEEIQESEADAMRGDAGQFKVQPGGGLEPDMRTTAEIYGRNEAEIGTLEMLDSAISDAQQNVDIKVLRAFLKEALANIL